MAFPLATLQAFPAAFWTNESRVNGVWNNLLSVSFQNNFVISPESVLDESVRRLRADLNVLQIIPPTGRDAASTPPPFAVALTFEGKREGVVAATVDAVISQLQEYATRVPSTNRNFFCIAANGSHFKLFVKTGASSLIGLKLKSGGGKPTVPSRTGTATSAAEHNLLTTNDYNDLIATLQWIAGHTFPNTTDF